MPLIAITYAGTDDAFSRQMPIKASVALGAIASSLVACEPAPAPERTGGRADESADTFFSDDSFYFLRLAGWRSDLMTPDSLTDFQSVPGAKFRVFESDPQSQLHCPDDEVDDARDLVFETDAFKIRTSGNLTKNTPKSSYKIKLGKQDRMFDMGAVNLKSMWNDVSQMRESLAWWMFNQAGVPSSRHTYAKFCIKDRYYGLYSVIEDVDDAFLTRHFGENDDGNLYKVYVKDLGHGDLTHRRSSSGDDSGRQYFKAKDLEGRTYELKTNEAPDDDPALQTYDDLARFIRVINGVGLPGGDEKFATPAYKAAVEEIFDVKSFLRWASLNVLLGAWDNYYATGANYFLYNSGKRGGKKSFMSAPYFHFIPHDYDNTFGIDFFDVNWQFGDIVDWEPTTAGYHDDGTTSKVPLVRNLLRNPDFLAYYLDHMEFLLDELFDEDVILRRIGDKGTGGIWDRVREPAFLEADGPTAAPHTGRQFTNDEVFANGFRHDQLRKGSEFILGILHYVRMRSDSARSQLAKLRATIPRGSSGATFPARPEPLPSL